jgi:hypothetical protein
LIVDVELEEKGTISVKEFELLWDWIGPALKKIRYQKYLLWLFENGFVLGGFVPHNPLNMKLLMKTDYLCIYFS